MKIIIINIKQKLNLIGKYYFIIFVVAHILYIFLPISIIDDNLRQDIFDFKLYTLSIAIFLIFIGNIKTIHFITDYIVVLIFTILATVVYYLLSLFIMFSSGMCGYIDKEVLYVKKYSQKTKIIIREFGCGAFDSGLPIVEVQKVHNYFNKVEFYTEIDTNQLNKYEWTRVDDKEK